MSVSFIVPVWREEVYETICKPWIMQQVEWFGAELIEVRGCKSIFESLEKGRLQAQHRYLFYVHDDVRLIKPAELVPQIAATFTALDRTGLIGPVGKVRRDCVPWWKNTGPTVGHYCVRNKQGHINYCSAKETGHLFVQMFKGADEDHDPCWSRFALAGLVDGFFLCEDRERVNVPWDVATYTEQWHSYDMDRCLQTHELGYNVRVAPWLFFHDCAGHVGYKGTDRKPVHKRAVSPGDKLWLSELDGSNAALNKKWGLAPVVDRRR